MDQVVKHEQLLDTAKDYFQFVTRFFEVIKVSAIHIYHSALELSPTSSIIRKLYYHRRVTRLPKVVTGTSESWAQSITISGKDDYNELCIWSPCGQFVAASMRQAVEIRNQLTLELITVLQPPEMIPGLTGPLAYSPDGRSIACASDIAIIIWDIQTGGVVKELGCSADNTSLVWSSNGGTICTIDSRDQMTFTVHTYDVSSGTALSPGTLQSGHFPHLWTVDESFRVMVTVSNVGYIETVNIFEVGPALTRIQSFSPHLFDVMADISFSPTTHHVSVLGPRTLSISDVRSSEVLLCPEGGFTSQIFSSDGSLFAASQGSLVYVWKYDSSHYALCGKFQSQNYVFPCLQLSPTLLSILSHSGNILEVLRLHELPTAPETCRYQYAGLSRSGTRVATAYRMESTVTTTDILAQTPPQFIDTDVAIESLFLTGNVLLVVGPGQIVAWLLTEEGLVDGVIGDRRVGRRDSIWTVSFRYVPWFRVEGLVGAIRIDENALHVYHKDTGEVLHPDQALRDNWVSPGGYHLGRNHLRFHNLPQCSAPLEDRWQTSRVTVREGWVKDAEGKHRLWVPVEWRGSWDPEDWLHDLTIQFSRLAGGPVLIKF